MITIHRPTALDLWWYAAVALVAAVLLALAMGASAEALNPPPPAIVLTGHHVGGPSPACFAMPHYPSIELVRAGCIR